MMGFSGIPMEPFSETALEMKEILQNELAFFGGYTNGYIGYLPTKEEFLYGGYEVELSPVVWIGYEFIDTTGGILRSWL